MTTSPHGKVSEALRLADEWRRETQREVDRRNSAYDHYGMGSTPETLDPLGANMAAELRRLSAFCRELEARLAKQSQEVRWQCGPQASGFTAQAAESVPEDVLRYFFDAGWKACANFCDREDVRFDSIVGHRGCPQFEDAFRAAWFGRRASDVPTV